MRIRFGLLVCLCALVLMSFVKNTKYKTLNSCAGGGCHLYMQGFIRTEPLENLKIKVIPEFKKRPAPVSAELVNEEGQIVDFQKTTYKREFILNAPRPGKYTILVGYQLSKPYWDSLSTVIKPSTISIPTSRYGASTFDFFPVHPHTVREGAVLRFILPRDSEVEIFLYTASGKPVNRIFKGRLGEGMHGIYWEAKDSFHRPLPPGEYLCEIRCDQKKLVQRLYVRQ